jgi:hypothetical protein
LLSSLRDGDGILAELQESTFQDENKMLGVVSRQFEAVVADRECNESTLNCISSSLSRIRDQDDEETIVAVMTVLCEAFASDEFFRYQCGGVKKRRKGKKFFFLVFFNPFRTCVPMQSCNSRLLGLFSIL